MDTSTTAFRAAMGATLLLAGVLLLSLSVGAARPDGSLRTAQASAPVAAQPEAA